MKLNLDDMHSMLSHAWEDVIDYYIDHVLHMEPTTQDEMIALKDSFKERFGKAGDKEIGAVATSVVLNGNKGAEDDPEGFYPGMEYSLPVSLYFMRRALDEDGRKYQQFKRDVRDMFDKQGKEQGPMPPKAFLKELVQPHLDHLQNISQPQDEANFDEDDAIVAQPEEHDHDNMQP